MSSALQGQRWPKELCHAVEAVVEHASSVQAEVDRAAVAKPETALVELRSAKGLVPPESLVAIAVTSLLGPTWAAVEGASWRPTVTKSRMAAGTVDYRIEFSLAARPQLVLLVQDRSVRGPTWRKRYKDPGRYAAALAQATRAATTAMRKGGWLRLASRALEARGWELAEQQRDTLLAAAGVEEAFFLRPPNAAGLLWWAPLGTDLRSVAGALTECASVQ